MLLPKTVKCVGGWLPRKPYKAFTVDHLSMLSFLGNEPFQISHGQHALKKYLDWRHRYSVQIWISNPTDLKKKNPTSFTPDVSVFCIMSQTATHLSGSGWVILGVALKPKRLTTVRRSSEGISGFRWGMDAARGGANFEDEGRCQSLPRFGDDGREIAQEMRRS